MKIKILKLICAAALASCVHYPKNENLSESWTPLSPSQHKKLIKKNTHSHKEYRGLYLVFSLHTTFLNSQVQKNHLKMQSQFSNWTTSEAEDKSRELETQLVESSQFFVSLYAPQAKNIRPDLKSSDWKVFLIYNGQSLEGNVKLQENMSDHNKVFFPYIDPWSRSYLATFPVSTISLEGQNFQVKFIGPEGMAVFEY